MGSHAHLDLAGEYLRTGLRHHPSGSRRGVSGALIKRPKQIETSSAAVVVTRLVAGFLAYAILGRLPAATGPYDSAGRFWLVGVDFGLGQNTCKIPDRARTRGARKRLNLLDVQIAHVECVVLDDRHERRRGERRGR